MAPLQEACRQLKQENRLLLAMIKRNVDAMTRLEERIQRLEQVSETQQASIRALQTLFREYLLEELGAESASMGVRAGEAGQGSGGARFGLFEMGDMSRSLSQLAASSPSSPTGGSPVARTPELRHRPVPQPPTAPPKTPLSAAALKPYRPPSATPSTLYDEPLDPEAAPAAPYVNAEPIELMRRAAWSPRDVADSPPMHGAAEVGKVHRLHSASSTAQLPPAGRAPPRTPDADAVRVRANTISTARTQPDLRRRCSRGHNASQRTMIRYIIDRLKTF